MFRRLFFLAVGLCAICAGQSYTVPIDLPDGTVGKPYDIQDFGAGEELTDEDLEGVTFTLSGTVPPGMTYDQKFRYFGTPTTAGTFRFTAVYTVSDGSFSLSATINFTHTIRPLAGAPLAIEPGAQTIGAVQGGPAQPRTFTLANRGAQARSFTVSATTNSGGDWLSASGGGSVGAFSNASISVSANPAGLAAGTYSGNVVVTVAPTGDRLTALVLLTVTGGQQALRLTQSGLTFQTVRGGVGPPPSSFNIFAASTGSLNWTAVPSVITGGNWLTITPGSGSATATSGGEVQVRVNPAGLAAGDYYGQIEVRSPGAANSPQIVAVVMNVAPPDQAPGALATPTGLIFTGRQGGANPAAQTVSLTSVTSAPVAYDASTRTDGSQTNRFSVTPPTGNVTGAQATRLTVNANLAGLAAGVYRGELVVRFADNSVRRVALLLIVLPRLNAATLAGDRARQAEGCTPTRLIPVFTLLGNSFRVAAGWPIPVEARVVDDCGDPMNSGSVLATFSNDDPPMALVNLQDGRWSWTWTPRNLAGQVTVTLQAQTTQPALTGTTQAGGSMTPNADVPVVFAGGAVSAASLRGQYPLSPGTYLSVFGSGLADSLNVATAFPLTTEMAGTRAVMGGQVLPLVFTSTGQVNALVPLDLPLNTTVQLVVRRGNRVSAPEPVTIAAADPGVFTKDQSGGGEGIVVAARADGSQFVVSPQTPSRAGDVLVIYCAGLGATNPPVPVGQQVPLSPLHQTVNPVTVRVGGVDAPVQFAGLVAGFTGLYQVNAVLPQGVAAGNSVQLVLTVAGQSSRPVTIAVQ